MGGRLQVFSSRISIDIPHTSQMNTIRVDYKLGRRENDEKKSKIKIKLQYRLSLIKYVFIIYLFNRCSLKVEKKNFSSLFIMLDN